MKQIPFSNLSGLTWVALSLFTQICWSAEAGLKPHYITVQSFYGKKGFSMPLVHQGVIDPSMGLAITKRHESKVFFNSKPQANHSPFGSLHLARCLSFFAMQNRFNVDRSFLNERLEELSKLHPNQVEIFSLWQAAPISRSGDEVVEGIDILQGLLLGQTLDWSWLTGNPTTKIHQTSMLVLSRGQDPLSSDTVHFTLPFEKHDPEHSTSFRRPDRWAYELGMGYTETAEGTNLFLMGLINIAREAALLDRDPDEIDIFVEALTPAHSRLYRSFGFSQVYTQKKDIPGSFDVLQATLDTLLRKNQDKVSALLPDLQNLMKSQVFEGDLFAGFKFYFTFLDLMFGSLYEDRISTRFRAAGTELVETFEPRLFGMWLLEHVRSLDQYKAIATVLEKLSALYETQDELNEPLRKIWSMQDRNIEKSDEHAIAYIYMSNLDRFGEDDYIERLLAAYVQRLEMELAKITVNLKVDQNTSIPGKIQLTSDTMISMVTKDPDVARAVHELFSGRVDLETILVGGKPYQAVNFPVEMIRRFKSYSQPSQDALIPWQKKTEYYIKRPLFLGY